LRRVSKDGDFGNVTHSRPGMQAARLAGLREQSIRGIFALQKGAGVPFLSCKA